MLKCPSNFHSPKMRIFKPKFERPDLFVSPTLELWFHGLFWRLNLTGPYRTHRTHGPMGSWEGKISPAEMGALSTNRSFQFFKPAEVANFGGDERNKGGKFPPNSNFCWILEGIHLPSISHIFRVCFALQKKTPAYLCAAKYYVKKSTPERIPLLQKILTQLWPENPTFPPRRIPSPGTRRMCPWRVTLFLTALAVVVHGAGSPLKLDRCWLLISSKAVQF